MNSRTTFIVSFSFLILWPWGVALQAASTLRAYPSDPSGNSPAFTRAHVDKFGRLLVFGSASGGPTNDKSIRVFDGTRWQYLWPNGYKNGGAQVRHNHMSFYVPRLNEFWVWGGSHLETLSGALRSGRFSLTEKRWLATSTTNSGAFDRILQGGTVFLSTMSAAWAGEPDMGIMFGGSVEGNATERQWIIEPNPAGPEPYRTVEFAGPRPPARTQCMNCMVAVGSDYYLFGGSYQNPGGPVDNRRDLWKFDGKKRAWTQLPNAPSTGYAPLLTYDSNANALVLWAGSKILVYHLAEQSWSDQTPAGLPCVINQVGGYLASINAHLYEGENDCTTGNSRGPQLIGISLSNAAPLGH